VPVLSRRPTRSQSLQTGDKTESDPLCGRELLVIEEVLFSVLKDVVLFFTSGIRGIQMISDFKVAVLLE